jgi:WS/DGAT/MGAT family acyltransferase
MELASDVGPVPLNVGALLVLDAPGADPRRLARVLAERAERVPRLSQRLVVPATPWRRPSWQPAGTPLSEQVGVRVCPAPGDSTALLAAAVSLLTTPLPRRRPLWRAHVLSGLADGGLAVVVVMHHVLADGIGGLAVLAALADTPARSHGPGRGRGTRAASVAAAPAPGAATDSRWGSLRAAGRELGGGRPRRAPSTSVNRPTGARRVMVSVACDLDGVRGTARRQGATVNDLLLVAVTEATGALLRERGETPSDLVVSVPVSARGGTTAGDLGNRVGVMPVRVPMGGRLDERLAAVAADTSTRRAGARGSSVRLVGPAFRALASTGLLRAFIDRQRLVNLFLTNVRGPADVLTLDGAPLRSVLPLTATQGNIGIAFAALSYAGSLRVVAVLDPDVVPEHELLREALAHALAALAALPAAPSTAARYRAWST